MSITNGKTFGRGAPGGASHEPGSMSIALVGDNNFERKVRYTGAFTFKGERFSNARGAWDFARAAAIDIEGVKQRLARDENLSEKGRTAALQDHVAEHMQKAAKLRRHTIQAGRDKITKKASALLEEAIKPPIDAASAIMDMELRLQFRSAQGEERTRLVQLAMSGQEPSLRDALLRISPALTGLADQTHSALRQQALSQEAVITMAALEEESKALGVAETALNTLEGIASELAGVGEPADTEEKDSAA